MQPLMLAIDIQQVFFVGDKERSQPNFAAVELLVRT